VHLVGFIYEIIKECRSKNIQNRSKSLKILERNCPQHNQNTCTYTQGDRLLFLGLLVHVGNYSNKDKTSHHKRPPFSATPLSERQISQDYWSLAQRQKTWPILKRVANLMMDDRSDVLAASHEYFSGRRTDSYRMWQRQRRSAEQSYWYLRIWKVNVLTERERYINRPKLMRLWQNWSKQDAEHHVPRSTYLANN